MKKRQIRKIYDSQLTSDGDGVKINRVAIHGNMQALDPFLLFDEILSDDASDYIGGFPPHPHRGFETVTYMLEGAFSHTDHMGNQGHLRAGGVQWMTAGKGVIHSEMPEQEQGRLHGFQIWVNLPAKDKMQRARYQGFEAEDIPTVQPEPGCVVRVIAGVFSEAQGPVTKIATRPAYYDIRLANAGSVDVPIVEQHNTIVYVYKGKITIEGQTVERGQLAQLEHGELVTLNAGEESGLLFLSAAVIEEPIAHHGPFVMNTREEIEQAIADYQNGVLTD